MSRWISVKDELPAIKRLVMTRSANTMHLSWLNPYDDVNNLDWQYSDCCGCVHENVLYWKPIPPEDE